MLLIKHSVNSDWLFNTQESGVLQADWFILETLNINMPIYWFIFLLPFLDLVEHFLVHATFLDNASITFHRSVALHTIQEATKH